VCDLLCNASHSKYGKLGPEAREALKATFGAFDWTLTVRDLDRRMSGQLDGDDVRGRLLHQARLVGY